MTHQMTLESELKQKLSNVQLLLRQKKTTAAVEQLVLMQQQYPQVLSIYQSLLPLLFHLGLLEQLQHHAAKAIEHLPTQLLGYQALSMALRFSHQHEQAIQTLLQARQQCGLSPALLHQLGVLYKEAGQLNQARQYLDQAIRMDPTQSDSWWQRADLLDTMSDDELKQLMSLAEQATQLKDKASFNYSLFSAYDKAGQYEQAFEALKRGAQAKRASLSYQPERELAEFKQIPLQFHSKLLQQKPLDEQLGQTAIFILGMPRSGTTLVEQIISSHSDVTAGDELFELGRACADLLATKDVQLPYPVWAKELQPEDWHQLGTNYLQRTAHLQRKGRFTDKMPLNFKAIGLIHQALPGAKIIHCRRNSMDTIWGCYRQLFAEGIAFSYDLHELKDYYLAYQELMDYWQQQLPEQILTIDYELLVHDQIAQSKRLLSFLDLPWQNQCLDFHQNSRSVHTVSNSQVRQPLFQSSVGNWKKYQSQLAVFASALEQKQKQDG